METFLYRHVSLSSSPLPEDDLQEAYDILNALDSQRILGIYYDAIRHHRDFMNGTPLDDFDLDDIELSYVFSRFILHCRGIQFEVSSIYSYLDVDLTNFLKSCLDHAPLFNTLLQMRLRLDHSSTIVTPSIIDVLASHETPPSDDSCTFVSVEESVVDDVQSLGSQSNPQRLDQLPELLPSDQPREVSQKKYDLCAAFRCMQAASRQECKLIPPRTKICIHTFGKEVCDLGCSLQHGHRLHRIQYGSNLCIKLVRAYINQRRESAMNAQPAQALPAIRCKSKPSSKRRVKRFRERAAAGRLSEPLCRTVNIRKSYAVSYVEYSRSVKFKSESVYRVKKRWGSYPTSNCRPEMLTTQVFESTWGRVPTSDATN